MRRWHKENIDSLIRFLKYHDYSAYLCDCLGKKYPTATEVDFILEYFDSSFKLCGGLAYQYILLRQGSFNKVMGIKAATLEIEKSRGDDIVVFAYSDGGVIVITGRPVDFQQNGVTADWWQIETSRLP